jgi:hypothetical protein
MIACSRFEATGNTKRFCKILSTGHEISNLSRIVLRLKVWKYAAIAR